MAGYQADRSMRESCLSCHIGKYKAAPGEGECQICPPYSKALSAGSVECRCDKITTERYLIQICNLY